MIKDYLKLENIEILNDFKKIVYFMKVSGVKAKFFVTSIILSLGLTLFSMYTVSLLLPLAQGIIKGDFGEVKTLAVVGNIVSRFPDFFAVSNTRLFLLLIFWVYFTIIIKNVLQYSAFLSTGYQSKISTKKLREVLLARCLGFSKKFYDSNTIAYLHNILTKSTDVIGKQFNLLQKFVIEVLLLVVYLIIMLSISWELTVISVVVFPIISIFTKRLVKKIRNMGLEYSTLSVNLSNRVLNLLYCMPLVKSYGKEDREKELFDKANKEEMESFFKIQKLTNLAPAIEDIGTTTGVLLVAIGMAWILTFDRSLTAAKALVFFYLALKIIPGLNFLNDFKFGMATAIGSIKEIDYILKNNDLFVVKDGEEKFDGLKKEIEIRNLNFSYDEDKNFAVKDVSFKIEKGKTTAIVGPTGSGKSTIANLILRFYDCPEESIYLD
jgi:ABC-type multidrug transport system fused ATPase/permease subunit